jgi:peroxiredoxin
MMQNVVRARYLGVGDALPDLTLPLLGGGELTLRSFRGKYVLLFLWASW